MAEQERSGPTPAQVEALTQVLIDSCSITEAEDADPGEEWPVYEALARVILRTIAAGEVSQALIAADEQWSVVEEWPGRTPERLLRAGESDARRMAEEGRSDPDCADINFRVERRLVGPWEPADEEAT